MARQVISMAVLTIALFVLCWMCTDNAAVAQGKAASADKGLLKALQKVPEKAQEHIIQNIQKGLPKGQSDQKKGEGKAKA